MNRDGYKDPTAEKAVADVMRVQRRKKATGGSSGEKSERKGSRSSKTV